MIAEWQIAPLHYPPVLIMEIFASLETF